MQYDLRKAATYDEMRILDKKVDGLPTFASVMDVNDKFRDYVKQASYNEWQSTTNQKVLHLINQESLMVSHVQLTDILNENRLETQNKLNLCVKAKDVEATFTEVKKMIEYNSSEDNDRNKELAYLQKTVREIQAKLD